MSTKDCNRPGLQRSLQAIKDNQVEAMVVYKLDRLARSVGDLANLVGLYNFAIVYFTTLLN